jgi:hypothetical protein
LTFQVAIRITRTVASPAEEPAGRRTPPAPTPASATPSPRTAPSHAADHTRLDELRAEYKRLINSMEFAYAMGHSRTLGRDPRLQPVVDRVDELRREIAILEQDEG